MFYTQVTVSMQEERKTRQDNAREGQAGFGRSREEKEPERLGSDDHRRSDGPTDRQTGKPLNGAHGTRHIAGAGHRESSLVGNRHFAGAGPRELSL